MSSGGRAVVARALLNFLTKTKDTLNNRSLLNKRQDCRIVYCRAVSLLRRKSSVSRERGDDGVGRNCFNFAHRKTHAENRGSTMTSLASIVYSNRAVKFDRETIDFQSRDYSRILDSARWSCLALGHPSRASNNIFYRKFLSILIIDHWLCYFFVNILLFVF